MSGRCAGGEADGDGSKRGPAAEVPRRPVVLVGHSLGAAGLASSFVHNPEGVDGIVLVAPAIIVSPFSVSPKLRSRKIMCAAPSSAPHTHALVPDQKPAMHLSVHFDGEGLPRPYAPCAVPTDSLNIMLSWPVSDESGCGAHHRHSVCPLLTARQLGQACSQRQCPRMHARVVSSQVCSAHAHAILQIRRVEPLTSGGV